MSGLNILLVWMEVPEDWHIYNLENLSQEDYDKIIKANNHFVGETPEKRDYHGTIIEEAPEDYDKIEEALSYLNLLISEYDETGNKKKDFVPLPEICKKEIGFISGDYTIVVSGFYM